MQTLLNKRSCKTRAYNHERVYVQDGLAITPSEMLTLSQQGIPISSQMLSETLFYDGEQSQLTDVPFALRRGVDIADVQCYQDSCRSKVKKAYETSTNKQA